MVMLMRGWFGEGVGGRHLAEGAADVAGESMGTQMISCRQLHA